MKTAGRLTNMQKELVKLFNYELNDGQLIDIKNMLSDYFANKATEQMDLFWDENNLNNKIMDQWLQEHLRKES